MANLRCKKCGGTDVSSESVKRRRLWAVVLGTSLIAVGFILLVWEFLGETYGSSFAGAIYVTVIPGFLLLSFGFRLDPVYIYTCKSCGNIWRRSAKKGPEEGDPRYVEWQTEWQSNRLALGDGASRVQAVKWLVEHRSISVESLIKCLGDRKLGVEDSRIEAASALKKIGDERAIQPLINAAMDTSLVYINVRVAAILALSAFDNDEIRKILENASNDKNDSVRKAASESLADKNQSI